MFDSMDNANNGHEFGDDRSNVFAVEFLTIRLVFAVSFDEDEGQIYCDQTNFALSHCCQAEDDC